MMPNIDSVNFCRNSQREMELFMRYCADKGWVRFPLIIPADRFNTDVASLLEDAREIVATAIAMGWARLPAAAKPPRSKRWCWAGAFPISTRLAPIRKAHAWNRLGVCAACGSERTRAPKENRVMEERADEGVEAEYGTDANEENVEVPA